MKKVFFVVSLFLLLSAPVIAAEPTSAGDKAVDVIFVRPLAATGSTISTAAYFIAAIPLHIIGVSHEAYSVMVINPWRFTACRPMGNYTECKDGTPVFE